jgi:hypothetical protein
MVFIKRCLPLGSSVVDHFTRGPKTQSYAVKGEKTNEQKLKDQGFVPLKFVRAGERTLDLLALVHSFSLPLPHSSGS